MAEIEPIGVTFFEEGGTVYFKNVMDARSAIGPREATEADAEKHRAEFDDFVKEYGKRKLIEAKAAVDDVSAAKALQDAIDEAEAKQAQAADDKRRAEEQSDNASADLKNTAQAVKDADAEAREQKEAQEKADAAAHAKAKAAKAK